MRVALTTVGIIVAAAVFFFGAWWFNEKASWELIPAIFASLVAGISLLLTYHTRLEVREVRVLTERREAALEGYERAVVGPVGDAIEIIDHLAKKIVEGCHKQSDHARQSAMAEVAGRLLSDIVNARRLCWEADSYISQQGGKSNFALVLHAIDPRESIDDVFARCVEIGQNAGQQIEAGSEAARLVELVSRQKARLRSSLTQKAIEIAQRPPIPVPPN